MKTQLLALSITLLSMTAPRIAAAINEPLPEVPQRTSNTFPRLKTSPPPETLPSSNASAAPETPSSAEIADSDPPKKIIPWGVNLFLGAGVPFGKPAAPSIGVREPTVAVGMGMSFSYWYVYTATGFSIMLFDDRNPLRQTIYSFEEGTQTAEANATALAGYVEIGLSHSFLIPIGLDTYLELMPSLGYGVEGVGPLQRSVSDCINCDMDTLSVDYQGGQYARAMFGTYWASGKPIRGRFGLTASYQRFLTPGSARMTDQLLFWMSVGVAKSN